VGPPNIREMETIFTKTCAGLGNLEVVVLRRVGGDIVFIDVKHTKPLQPLVMRVDECGSATSASAAIRNIPCATHMFGLARGSPWLHYGDQSIVA
jgi:hypothetical protein